eukprot:gene3315-4172_t
MSFMLALGETEIPDGDPISIWMGTGAALAMALLLLLLAVAVMRRPPDVADVIERKTDGGETSYYVHYVDYNKRLDEWVPAEKISSASADSARNLYSRELLTPGSDRKLTRNLKRRYDEIHHVPKAVEELNPIDQTLEKEHEEKTKVKNIQVIEMGRWEVDTWYYSPYPDEYARESKLYICQFCLKYMKKKKTLLRHRAKVCGTAQERPLSIFEVDGKKNKVYCQNLCLIAKLFLDHKTLYYDVDPFLFYILTEYDEQGYHIVGYFSKEKHSSEDYNLACILTLPPYQRKGYGRFLIAFSYELSKKEGRVGTPERPLSDLGQVSFRSYWTRVLLDILKEHRGNLSIKDLSTMTAIRSDDVVSTLQSLNLIKYWKGQYIISVTPKIIEEHLKNMSSQPYPEIDPATLHWTPL